MMKPEFRHKPRNSNNKSPSPKRQPASSKLSITPLPPPNTSQARRNSNTPTSQILKPNRNRLLAPSSKQLVLLEEEQKEATGAEHTSSGSSSTNTGKELVVYQSNGSSSRRLTDGLPLPDAQISVDKLLAQWADKIEKAEQEFMLEEMAFERANDRLQSRNRKKSLQALTQHPRTGIVLATNVQRISRLISCPRLSSISKDAPPK